MHLYIYTYEDGSVNSTRPSQIPMASRCELNLHRREHEGVRATVTPMNEGTYTCTCIYNIYKYIQYIQYIQYTKYELWKFDI